MPAARFVMYQAFFSTGCLHFLTREMPTMLIPLICEEMGFGMAERGALLGVRHHLPSLAGTDGGV